MRPATPTGPAGCYRHPTATAWEAGYCPVHLSPLIAPASAPVCRDALVRARVDITTWRHGYATMRTARRGWTIGDPDPLAACYRAAIGNARRVLLAAGVPVPRRHVRLSDGARLSDPRPIPGGIAR